MARYVTDIETKKSTEEVNRIVQDFMQKEGFSFLTYNGEQVWKKGMGILTGPQFLKTAAKDGRVRLEAWVKYALLPGVYIGELGITGFFGYAIKAALRKRVTNLENMLKG